MFIELFIKLLVSIISLSSIVLLTFSIFRIPVKDNDKQIALLGLFLGATNFYFKFVLLSEYSFLVLLFTFFVLIKLFRGYPIFFSLVVCLTGLLGASLVDMVISLVGILTKLTTTELMQTSSVHYLLLNIISAIICFSISILLRKLKVGFSFIVSRYHGKYSLRSYNFIWLGILVIGGIIIQYTVMEKHNFSTYGGYLLATLYIVFIVGIAYAAIQNKKSTDARIAAMRNTKKDVI
jgi:hypothetical protein